jgi:hypothetical protein
LTRKLTDSLILGSNPLTGTDHFLRERVRDSGKRRSLDDAVRVLEASFDSGARGFNFNTGPTVNQLLLQLREKGFEKEVGLYPIIPNTDFGANLLGRGTAGMLSALLADLSAGQKARTVLSGAWAYLTSDPLSAISTYVKTERDRLTRAAPPSMKIRTFLVHELLTDTMVGMGAVEPLREYISQMRRNLRLPPGFITRNFPHFLALLKANEIDPTELVIMTPVNSIGFQMTPDRVTVEQALEELGSTNIIAMNILGGGLVRFENALTYFRSVKGVGAVAVGVSSVEHALSTFRALEKSVPWS